MIRRWNKPVGFLLPFEREYPSWKWFYRIAFVQSHPPNILPCSRVGETWLHLISNLVPRAFPSKNGWKALGTRSTWSRDHLFDLKPQRGSILELPACRRLLLPLLQPLEIGYVCTQARHKQCRINFDVGGERPGAKFFQISWTDKKE